MIARLALIGLLLVTSISAAWADTYVHGYWRRNGTYVQPHYRSAPDNSYDNNWSVLPNTSPYAFRQGTPSPTWNDQALSRGLRELRATCTAYSVYC